MIAPWAFKYIGLPYKDACWGPEFFDCWGLLSHVYKEEFEIDITQDMTMYNSRVGKVKRLAKYVSLWRPVDEPKVGDGVLFLIHGTTPHCSIYIGDGKVLHAVEGIDSCIDTISSPRWKSRLEGYYEYVGPRTSET